MLGLLVGSFCHVSEKSPKLAGEFVVVKSLVGKIAKVVKLGVGGNFVGPEYAIWAPLLEVPAPKAAAACFA